MIQYPRYRQHRFSSFQVIIAGFAAVDLVGALFRCFQSLHSSGALCTVPRRCLLHLCPLRDRACGSGYRQLLVGIRAERNSSSDPDRRDWGVITVGAVCAAFRAKDLLASAQHDAGSSAPQMGGIVRLTGFILRITALLPPQMNCGAADHCPV